MKLLFSLFVLISMCVGAQAQYIPSNGLVAYYPFIGNAEDSINGYDLYPNGAILCPDRFGRTDNAFSFDGINDYLNSTVELPQGTDFTYSVWFLSESANHRGVILHNGNGIANGIGLIQNNGSTFPGANNPGDLITFYAGGINFFYSKKAALNSWHHVALRCAGNHFDYFFDNVLVGSGSFTSLAPSGRFYVGYDSVNTANPFKGKIDDIALYNRPLTDSEIDSLYNGCTAEIVLQPANVAVVNGNTATFYTVASSVQAIYQWQMDAGTGYINLSDAGPFSGTSTDTLKVDIQTLAFNSNNFRVIVTNDFKCKDTSLPAKLTIWPTGINELQPKAKLRLFPNPTSGSFFADIDVSPNVSLSSMEVFDHLGKKVVQREVQPSTSRLYINLNGQVPGLYLIRLTSLDGEILGTETIMIKN